MDSTTSILQPGPDNPMEQNIPNINNLEESGNNRYGLRKRKVQPTKEATKKIVSMKSKSEKKAILEENTVKQPKHLLNSEKKASEASTSGKVSSNKSGKISCDSDNAEGKIAQEKLIKELSKVEKIEEEESKSAQEVNKKGVKSNKRAQLKRKTPSSPETHIQKKTKLNSEEKKDSGEKVAIKLTAKSKSEALELDFEFEKEGKNNEIVQGTRVAIGQSISTTTENTSEKMNDFETNSNAMEIINQPAFNFFEHQEKKNMERPVGVVNSELENSHISEGSQHMMTADSVIRYKGGLYQAKIPRLRMKSSNKKCKQVWSPEMINQEEFATYMNKISDILKTSSDRLNEEKVLKILTQNEQNVGKSLEYIKKNINSVRRDIVLRNRYSVQ